MKLDNERASGEEESRVHGGCVFIVGAGPSGLFSAWLKHKRVSCAGPSPQSARGLLHRRAKSVHEHVPPAFRSRRPGSARTTERNSSLFIRRFWGIFDQVVVQARQALVRSAPRDQAESACAQRPPDWDAEMAPQPLPFRPVVMSLALYNSEVDDQSQARFPPPNAASARQLRPIMPTNLHRRLCGSP
jgi:hypothetical protein